MKKIILIFIFGVLIVSCGKKSDPEYKASHIIETYKNI